MSSVGPEKLFTLVSSLGRVIHETDIVIDPERRGLLTSWKFLDFHTDHSMADYIAWICVKPAKEGGETILMDARKAFSLLHSDDQKILATIMLKEHRIFKNDPSQFPLVSNKNGNLKFYYSFWLATENMSDSQKRVFNAFRRAVAVTPFHQLKLYSNDILIVDNSCIFHGRRAIMDPTRQLKRFWINSTCNIAGGNHAHTSSRY